MDKFAWFEIGPERTLLRVSPPQTLETIREEYPDAKEVHFLWEAKMILGLPFNERQAYIDKTPAEQQEQLKAEIKRQWEKRKCKP